MSRVKQQLENEEFLNCKQCNCLWRESQLSDGICPDCWEIYSQDWSRRMNEPKTKDYFICIKSHCEAPDFEEGFTGTWKDKETLAEYLCGHSPYFHDWDARVLVKYITEVTE